MECSITTSKPSWVVALDRAQDALLQAAEQDTPECTDSKTRIAYGWMDVSRLLKG